MARVGRVGRFRRLMSVASEHRRHRIHAAVPQHRQEEPLARACPFSFTGFRDQIVSRQGEDSLLSVLAVRYRAILTVVARH